MSYETSKVAQQYYNVSYETLRKWETQGKIKAQKTKGGHRRYYVPPQKVNTQKISVIYARVSSAKQKAELKNQINFLKQKYPTHEIISDIGSGINFKRKGFISLLDRVFEGEIKEIMVANKDRFTRFGFQFLQHICKKFGCELKSVSKEKYNPTKELSEDIMSIITVFSSRYYGLRSYSKVKKNKSLPKSTPKKTLQKMF